MVASHQSQLQPLLPSKVCQSSAQKDMNHQSKLLFKFHSSD
jgi:hypothetical protein